MAETQGADARALLGLIRRDPHHLPERLVVFAAARLGVPAREWVARRQAETGYDPDALVERMRQETAVRARVEGAIAGTPFLLALVPAYVQALWMQMWLVLRIAAIHGRDPGDAAIAAEILAIRGVHSTPESAAIAISELRDDEPDQGWRAPIRTWIVLVYRVLILAGFLEAPGRGPQRSRWAVAAGVVGAGVIWVVTWIVPVAFMVAMSWACESDAGRTSARAQHWYAERAADRHPTDRPARIAVARDRGSRTRRIVRVLIIGLAFGTPLAFLAVGVTHGDADHAALRVGAVVVALSLVLAFSVLLRREQRR